MIGSAGCTQFLTQSAKRPPKFGDAAGTLFLLGLIAECREDVHQEKMWWSDETPPNPLALSRKTIAV